MAAATTNVARRFLLPCRTTRRKIAVSTAPPAKARTVSKENLNTIVGFTCLSEARNAASTPMLKLEVHITSFSKARSSLDSFNAGDVSLGFMQLLYHAIRVPQDAGEKYPC